MAQFEYGNVLQGLMTPEIMSALGNVREHRGRQELYKSLQPAVLDKLCEVAKIQSTGASNRIESISTSEVRLRELMERKVEPKNRDEREIAGYRYVLDMIHESYDAIPVTSGVVLQLHRDLYRFLDVSFAGRWKDSDNVIAERADDGSMVARFVPTSAAATPAAIDRICEEYASWSRDGAYDPLLVSLVFVFDFVSIHPFSDGNGRMSRLLTLLLTYRSGYDVGKYVSIEAEIERTKGTYYEALAASSSGWSEGMNDYAPFVTYMLGVMTACYVDLDARVALLSSGGKGEDILRAYFANLVGAVTKRQILDDNPTLSRRTAERVLQKLQAEGYIEKVGAARSTAYRRVD
ncbi:MAG: Fic family protein [Eggerthellaceae bacterium]|nr:Fic family protein [Eggerthellaceae bacterium]